MQSKTKSLLLTLALGVASYCCASLSAPSKDVSAGAMMPDGSSPVLNFSDLVSGPNTGNSDISLGQTAGTDGAIVTIWGTGLGTAQGTSKVVVNGATADHIYYWGDAKPPYSPSDLNKYHKMQVVIFQVSHQAKEGAGTITVTVGGKTSNPLPFTVRAGRIFFVKTTGDDKTGDGSWSKPWATLPKIVSKGAMVAGDMTYVCDGIKQEKEDNYKAALNLIVKGGGTSNSPLALVAFPGATVSIGTSTVYYGIRSFISDKTNFGPYWTLAKLHVTGETMAVGMGTGWRMICNFITVPTGDGPTGGVTGTGDDLFFMGNEVTKVGAPGCSKLYHPLYISSPRAMKGPRLPAEANREIAWNYFHDNNANRAINIFSEQASTAYMSGHKVHDNFIINQVGGGILLGNYMTGENWAYNNVVANAGLGPEPKTSDPQGHIGVEIDCGVRDGSAPATMYFFNNTIYGCGWHQGNLCANGHVTFQNTENFTLVFKNNIIVSTGNPFFVPYGQPPKKGDWSGNLWFGLPNPPTWDTAPMTANPMFVNPESGDFHLKPGSPAIKKAKSTDTNTFAPLAFENVPRPQGGNFDLGAYESVQP